MIGDLILGDNSFGQLLESKHGSPSFLQLGDRDKEYPKKAIAVLQHGDPDSSAGGEQPKFSAVIEKGTPVLVKFSPKVESDVGQRYADLLVCEHISLTVLNKHGQLATKSALVFADNRVFLETERFDRIGHQGRKGLVSLAALDNEFVGKRGSWTTCAKELLQQQLINQKNFDDIRWRETFGRLIGNTDMHFANISFFFQTRNILDLAPAYDMLPMLYAPQNGQIVEREFNPPLPKPADSDIWKTVWTAARDFWSEVSVNKHISSGFQKIAQANLEKIRRLEHLQGLLPL